MQYVRVWQQQRARLSSTVCRLLLRIPKRSSARSTYTHTHTNTQAGTILSLLVLNFFGWGATIVVFVVVFISFSTDLCKFLCLYVSHACSCRLCVCVYRCGGPQQQQAKTQIIENQCDHTQLTKVGKKERKKCTGYVVEIFTTNREDIDKCISNLSTLLFWQFKITSIY